MKKYLSLGFRLSLFVAAVVLMLSLVNILTRDTIAERQRIAGETARSALLSGTDSMERYASRLEQLYLSCRSEGRNLSFGLLADLPASDSESCPEDGELLRCGRIAVNSLNRKYGGGFFLRGGGADHGTAGIRALGQSRKRGVPGL